MTSNYVPYHVHTMLSLLDSCTSFTDYVDLAAEQGIQAIAFSEHGKPLQWTEKLAYCQKKGVKFLHAVEIYLTEQLEPQVRDNYHTVLIAKNDAGVKELNRLIEVSTRDESTGDDHVYYNNRLSFDEFLGISDNVIKTSACLASPLARLPHDHPRYMELARHYDYLEIQPHINQEQADYNRWLYELSKETGVPLIAATDTHSLNQYKADCRKILMKYKGQSYGDEDSFDLTWKTFDELKEMFRLQNALPEDVYMEAIENTNRMAASCEEIHADTSIRYPISYGSREEDARKFNELVELKFNEKLRDGIIPASQREAFRAAIDEEMAVFHKLNMEGFMLSMAELIGWCRSSDIAIGTARGSVGGSRVAYVTDIIDLNPEQWHTVFSRFCNENRTEIGDQWSPFVVTQ